MAVSVARLVEQKPQTARLKVYIKNVGCLSNDYASPRTCTCKNMDFVLTPIKMIKYSHPLLVTYEIIKLFKLLMPRACKRSTNQPIRLCTNLQIVFSPRPSPTSNTLGQS